MPKFLDENGLSIVVKDYSDKIDAKQDALISGENIKSINGESLLGSGNIRIEAIEIVDLTQINE